MHHYAKVPNRLHRSLESFESGLRAIVRRSGWLEFPHRFESSRLTVSTILIQRNSSFVIRNLNWGWGESREEEWRWVLPIFIAVH